MRDTEPLPATLTLGDLQRHWTRIVGPQVAAVTWPLIVVDGDQLVVNTATFSWQQELEQLAPAVIASLPSIDGHVVRSIVWRYAPPTRATVAHHARRGARR